MIFHLSGIIGSPLGGRSLAVTADERLPIAASVSLDCLSGSSSRSTRLLFFQDLLVCIGSEGFRITEASGGLAASSTASYEALTSPIRLRLVLEAAGPKKWKSMISDKMTSSEPNMLDHVSLGVSNVERSRQFYDAVLRPVGLVRTVDFQGRGSDYLSPLQGMHICFRAPNREAVHAFYTAALTAGGRDDGKPGVRQQYHPDYYAAFVIDPDGHRIEVVCHAPEVPMVV